MAEAPDPVDEGSMQGKKRHRCSDCGKMFVSPSALAIHMRSHTGDRPFLCPFCPYAAAQAGDLQRHMRTHTGERPYQCPHCPYAATTASHLQAHMRTHTGERPYLCPHCPYAATTASHLQSHIRTHTGERPYLCSACGEAFAYLKSAKRHVARCQHGQEAQDAGANMAENPSSEGEEEMFEPQPQEEFLCGWCEEPSAGGCEHERSHGPVSSWLLACPAQTGPERGSSACSFCCAEYADVSQAQACERGHTAVAGGEREEGGNYKFNDYDNVDDDDDDL